MMFWSLTCSQDARLLQTLTWQHRSSSSDCWCQPPRAWTRSICAATTWGHAPLVDQPPVLCLSLSHAVPPGVLQEQQYAQWMAACRLGSKGKTLADDSFQSEIQTIRSFLAMQRSSSNSHGNTPANDESINTHSLVSPRYHKKYKTKQVPGGEDNGAESGFKHVTSAQFLFTEHDVLG